MSGPTTERRALRSKWPDAFDDGVRCGLLPDPDETPPREPGGYPRGFHSWPLEKRNAWFCGFNIGFQKREARHA